MTLHPKGPQEIPEQTAEIARASFPKGNVYMTMRDQLGELFCDKQFSALYASNVGTTAYSPARLAMVSVMQCAEGLSDRQAAMMVGSRIDWKYALGLDIRASGFDHSVLSEFRARVVGGESEQLVLEKLLAKCKEQGWLKRQGMVRSDSTHVVAAVRQLNRLEMVGETLRHALEGLAEAAPEWLQGWVPVEWFDRYGTRIECQRLPKKKTEQTAWAEQVGADGHQLLSKLEAASSMARLQQMQAVEVLRQVWRQQFYCEGETVKLRDKELGLPPHSKLIHSPYDVEARYRTKRSTHWTGYEVHLSETCDTDTPALIVNVETTPATASDSATLPQIHEGLAQQGLAPETHFVDSGYVTVDNLLDGKAHDIDLYGPAAGDTSWQARREDGLDLSTFQIDWDKQSVRCPAGKTSQYWRPRTESDGDRVIEVVFAKADCHSCPLRSACTRNKASPRVLKFKPKLEYDTLQAARARQQTSKFKARYRKRAGIEGTISQGVNAFNLRRTRYVGLAKTHLLHVLTATAINLFRLHDWLMNKPRAKTRCSHFKRLDPTLAGVTLPAKG